SLARRSSRSFSMFERTCFCSATYSVMAIAPSRACCSLRKAALALVFTWSLAASLVCVSVIRSPGLRGGTETGCGPSVRGRRPCGVVRGCPRAAFAAGLFLFDRDAGGADRELDALRLPVVVIDLVAQSRDRDDEPADDEKQQISRNRHDGRPRWRDNAGGAVKFHM